MQWQKQQQQKRRWQWSQRFISIKEKWKVSFFVSVCVSINYYRVHRQKWMSRCSMILLNDFWWSYTIVKALYSCLISVECRVESWAINNKWIYIFILFNQEEIANSLSIFGIVHISFLFFSFLFRKIQIHSFIMIIWVAHARFINNELASV